MKHVLRFFGLLSAFIIGVLALNILAPSLVPDVLDISGLLSKATFSEGTRLKPEEKPKGGLLAPEGNGEIAASPLTSKDGSQISSDLLSLKYFRARLNEQEVEVYDTIYQAVEDGIDELNIKDRGIKKDSLLEVFDLYRMDCPEHYWIDNMQIKYQGIGHIVTQINFKYNSTLDSRDSYDKQVASLVDQIKGQNIGAREYDKVKYVHDFIVTSTSYEESSIHNQNIISVLINKSSVCAGYAKATQYLLNELGIECLYVSGFSKGEAHAWNIVKVNDAYYNLDTTWDDPIITDSATAIDFEKYISYRYFLITDDQLKKTHEQVAPPSINIPTCNSTSMNYFVKEGLLYDQFDANTMNAIASKLSHDMLNGQRPQFLAFKFTNNQAYSFYMDQLASTWHQIATIVNEGLGNDLINPYSVSNLSSGGDEDIVEMIIYYR